MKTSLYNQDGSLSPEAQILISHRPDNVSRKGWIKRLKDFRSQLSPEDLKEFERLRKNKGTAKRRAENPEKGKQDRAKWRAENPDYSAKWYAENTEKVKQDNARRSAEKRAKDPLYRLQNSMRSNCTRVVKQLSLGKKPTSTFKWIGCSPEELKEHLESLFTEGMTWENYGEWHVDHIRPICSFTAEEWEQVNHYSNLRPLWAEDNLTKSGFDRRQSVRSNSNTNAVEVSEPEKSQTPSINKE